MVVAATALKVASVAKALCSLVSYGDQRGAVRGGDVGGVGNFGAEQDQLDLAGDYLVLQSLLGMLELGGAGGQRRFAPVPRGRRRGPWLPSASGAIAVAVLVAV